MSNRILKGLAVVAGTGLAMGFTSGRVRVRSAYNGWMPPPPPPQNGNPLPYAGGNGYPAPYPGNAGPAPYAGNAYTVPGAPVSYSEMPHGAPQPQNPLAPPAYSAPHQAPPQTDSYTDINEVELLNIEPLLDRLEQVEFRIESIEQRPPVVIPPPPPPRTESPELIAKAAAESAAYTAKLSDLDRRVEQNTHELSLLREQVGEAERRINESMASVHRKIEETRQEIPVLVENNVNSRITELGNRFAVEIEQSHQRTLETFERAIDEKISSRIGSIERALAEQAGSIEALRVRATETDDNLQRLVSAIEKLCERAQLIAPAPAPEVRLPQQPQFEGQLQDAMRREMVKPTMVGEEPVVKAAARPVPPPAFAAGPAAKTPPQAPPAKKSRFLFRSLFVPAVTSLLASRTFWK